MLEIKILVEVCEMLAKGSNKLKTSVLYSNNWNGLVELFKSDLEKLQTELLRFVQRDNNNQSYVLAPEKPKLVELNDKLERLIQRVEILFRAFGLKDVDYNWLNEAIHKYREEHSEAVKKLARDNIRLTQDVVQLTNQVDALKTRTQDYNEGLGRYKEAKDENVRLKTEVRQSQVSHGVLLSVVGVLNESSMSPQAKVQAQLAMLGSLQPQTLTEAPAPAQPEPAAAKPTATSAYQSPVPLFTAKPVSFALKKAPAVNSTLSPSQSGT